MGYTSEVTCGVWVGLDQPDTIAPGGYGGKLALPIWADTMNAAVAHGYQQEVPQAEPVLARVNLCRLTGLLATDGCAAAGHAYADDLPADMVPPGYCNAHGGGVIVQRRQGDSKPGFFKRVFGGLFK